MSIENLNFQQYEDLHRKRFNGEGLTQEINTLILNSKVFLKSITEIEAADANSITTGELLITLIDSRGGNIPIHIYLDDKSFTDPGRAIRELITNKIYSVINSNDTFLLKSVIYKYRIQAKLSDDFVSENHIVESRSELIG
ncbi:MAG: hypothetical protein H3C64_02730 [Candidatus Kuenenia stuttgartiensis]|nr:hypothetical protein [Candidatus Kuenenia stuttgartiensis]